MAIHNMLVPSSSASNAQMVPRLFFSYLSFTYLHIVVASATAGLTTQLVGLWLTYSV